VSTLLAVHDELEKEPKGPWGESTERTLGEYVGKQSDASGIEVFALSCHTTRCEIQAADVQSSDGPLDDRGFSHGMRQQPWFVEGIQDMETYVTKIDGRTVYWTYLIRRQ
jgi:hypothetical protein